MSSSKAAEVQLSAESKQFTVLISGDWLDDFFSAHKPDVVSRTVGHSDI